MVTYRIALGPELDWLPDDTEEALLGTTIHQGVIVALDTSLNHFKQLSRLPWLIGNQLRLIIPRQGGRGTYQPSPDILIHPTLGDAQLSSLSVAQYGPPALAIEIASPGTAREHDLNTLAPGVKPAAYAQAGIAEYLVFDPLGDTIPNHVHAWRMGPENVYVPWPPDPNTGRWHSALGISFAPQGLRLRVYDGDGALVPTMSELHDENAALRAELRRLRGE